MISSRGTTTPLCATVTENGPERTATTGAPARTPIGRAPSGAAADEAESKKGAIADARKVLDEDLPTLHTLPPLHPTGTFSHLLAPSHAFSRLLRQVRR